MSGGPKTVKTVAEFAAVRITPLKWGVNETRIRVGDGRIYAGAIFKGLCLINTSLQ